MACISPALQSHAAYGTSPPDGTMRAVAEFLGRVKETQ